MRGVLLPSRFDTLGLVCDSVAAVEESVAHLVEGSATPVVPLRVAAACSSDRLMRVGGEPVRGFAPASGFFRTSDAWVRTHANYPHHRERLLTMLGLPADAGRDALASAIARLDAQAVEDRAASVGALAVRARTVEEWTSTPQGRAAAEGPTVRVTSAPPAQARGGRRAPGPRDAPLAGVRVLDLTRVIAGPVATRTLALLGADVLRLDPPAMPEIPVQHRDTGQGKRTAFADLRDPEVLARVQALLDAADVLVTGYRPGAVEALGLRHPPGIVAARVTAWSAGEGPWAGRRGFDSLVQSACGIAIVEGSADDPGALPAQALDHATGYLLAAAVIDAWRERCARGVGASITATLARTAAALVGRGVASGDLPPAAPLDDGTLVTHGEFTTARPALAAYGDYAAPAHPLGADDLTWL